MDAGEIVDEGEDNRGSGEGDMEDGQIGMDDELDREERLRQLLIAKKALDEDIADLQ